MLFPIILTFLSFTNISTIFIPAFWMSSATSSDIISPACTSTSPVSLSIISFADTFPLILPASPSF